MAPTPPPPKYILVGPCPFPSPLLCDCLQWVITELVCLWEQPGVYSSYKSPPTLILLCPPCYSHACVQSNNDKAYSHVYILPHGMHGVLVLPGLTPINYAWVGFSKTEYLESGLCQKFLNACTTAVKHVYACITVRYVLSQVLLFLQELTFN